MNSEKPTEGKNKPLKSRPSSGSIWFPVALMIIGFIFLAQQIGNFEFNNWWAFFILIPAFSSFGTAYGIWQRTRRFTFGVWSTFYGGLFPLLVALMFLFNLDWGRYWPLFVILPGVGMMISGLPIKRQEDTKIPAALLCHRPWVFFIGLSATLLGLTFLGMNLDRLETIRYLKTENWWGIFILIPALGGLITAFRLLVGGHSVILTVINLAGAVVIGLTGIVALLNLDWNLLNLVTPIILILAGLGLIVGFGGKKEQGGS
jgi:hypothetical protein